MKSNTIMAVVSVTIVCMLLMPVAPAYAEASTVIASPQNGISAEYVALGLYSYKNYESESEISEIAYSESLFDQVDDTVFNTGRITYSSGSTYNEIRSTFRMTPVNLYIVVQGSADEYYLNGNDVTVTVTGFPQSATVTSSINFGLREYDDTNERWVIQGNTAYYLTLDVYVECRYTPGVDDPEPEITVNIAALYDTTRSYYYEIDMPITLSQSGIIEEIIAENEGSDVIIDSVDDNLQYHIEASEPEESGGESYQTITLTNGKGDGNLLDIEHNGNTHKDVNFSLDIPPGKEFVLNLQTSSKSATFYITVELFDDNGTKVGQYHGGKFNLNGNKSYYYTPGSNGSIHSNNSFNPNGSGWAWFSSPTGGVAKVTLDGNAGYGLKVFFVFNTSD